MIRRALRRGELAVCLSVDPGRIGTELTTYSRAMDVWNELARSPSFHSTVVEADPPIAGHRIVGFGASVFVSRDFAEEEISNPRPGLNARIVASVHSGSPAALNNSQLRSVNSEEGLDLLILYPTWREGILNAKQVSETQVLLAAGFMEDHLGFRFNRLVTEVRDAHERDFYARPAGWQIVSEFESFYAGNASTCWNKGRSLAVITRDDASRIPGHIVSMIFQYREPKLGLSEAEQQFLSTALKGLTDDELADTLGLGLPTVKKRWRSLFERTSAHPDLFPHMNDGLDDAGRGKQKRQFILAYVRDHPEELKPFQARK